jgi:hypothetical protein
MCRSNLINNWLKHYRVKFTLADLDYTSSAPRRRLKRAGEECREFGMGDNCGKAGFVPHANALDRGHVPQLNQRKHSRTRMRLHQTGETPAQVPVTFRRAGSLARHGIKFGCSANFA